MRSSKPVRMTIYSSFGVSKRLNSYGHITLAAVLCFTTSGNRKSWVCVSEGEGCGVRIPYFTQILGKVATCRTDHQSGQPYLQFWPVTAGHSKSE